MTLEELQRLRKTPHTRFHLQGLINDLWFGRPMRRLNPQLLQQFQELNMSALDEIIFNKSKTPSLCEDEWTFPKGRGKDNEDGILTAKREFHEETLLDSSYLTVENGGPYLYLYHGEDGRSYCNCMYVAFLSEASESVAIEATDTSPLRSKRHSTEASEIGWFTLSEAHNYLSKDLFDFLKSIDLIVNSQLKIED